MIIIKETKNDITIEGYRKFLFTSSQLKDAYTLLKNASIFSDKKNTQKNFLCLLDLLFFNCNEKTDEETIKTLEMLALDIKTKKISKEKIDSIKSFFICCLYLSFLNAFNKINIKDELKIYKINFMQSILLFEHFIKDCSLFPLYNFSTYSFFDSEKDFTFYSVLVDAETIPGFHINNKKNKQHNIFFLKEDGIKVIQNIKPFIAGKQNCKKLKTTNNVVTAFSFA